MNETVGTLISIGGPALGVAVYLVAMWRDKGRMDVRRAMECGLCGYGFALGLHLMWGAVRGPEELVEIRRANGDSIAPGDLYEKRDNQFRPMAIQLKFSDSHRAHVFLGGICAALIGLIGMREWCKVEEVPQPQPKQPSRPRHKKLQRRR